MMDRHPRSATITAPAPNEPLSQRLRTATHELHRAAESSAFVRRLLRRELDLAAYAALLQQLQALYEALERGLERRGEMPGFAAFGFQALRRAPALVADLQTIGAARVSLQPATHTFVERLHDLAENDPMRLVAHAYVRYLGDLNGGQMLRKAVQASPALAAAGTAFYAFDDTAGAIGRFRAALDALPAAHAPAIVDEACWSFEQHRRLFDELAR